MFVSSGLEFIVFFRMKHVLVIMIAKASIKAINIIMITEAIIAADVFPLREPESKHE